MGTATGTDFNTAADGGNHLTAQDLITRPVSEWDAAMQGKQPENPEMFARNLRNTLQQDFDKILSERAIFGLNSEFNRIHSGALYPRDGAYYAGYYETTSAAAKNALEDVFEKARADKTYGADQLRQDLLKARDQVMERVDQVVEKLGKPGTGPEPTPEPARDASVQAAAPGAPTFA